MRDRAEWQVAHNSTDKNKATPLILVIFYRKHSQSVICKCLMCNLVSNAEWKEGEGGFICMPTSKRALGFEQI